MIMTRSALETEECRHGKDIICLGKAAVRMTEVIKERFYLIAN
jgi:hypothetical protein